MVGDSEMSAESNNGREEQARAVLIIGVHREELDFGDRVSEGLDSGRIEILRIPRGLPARRPSQEDAFYYRTNHQELYLQMLPQIRGRYRLVIDLHCGINEPGPCADLFSADAALLDCVCSASLGCNDNGPDQVRAVLLGDTDPPGQTADSRLLRAHTIIPEPIWNNPELTYLGLEIFMPVIGVDDPAARALAQGLIDSIVGCATDLRII